MKILVNITLDVPSVESPKNKRRLPRRKSFKKNSKKNKMTQEIADAIRLEYNTTKRTQAEIGNRFGFNQGNVSKILHNTWYPEITNTFH